MIQKDNDNKTLVHFFLWFLGIFAVWMLAYVVGKAYNNNQLSIFNLLIPVTLGVTYENLKISNNWKYTLLKIFGTLVLSLMAFIESENSENFSFNENFNSWVYAFIGLLVFISMIFHKDRVILKITEGTTLLQSISFIYWILTIFQDKIIDRYIISTLVLSFSLFSFYHAFSYRKLTRNSKLVLSLWSAFMMLLFSIKTLVVFLKDKSYQNTEILTIASIYGNYFILGISLVYLMKNAEMLLGYFPEKNSGYKK